MASKGKEQTAESIAPEQPARAALDTTVPGGRYLVNGRLVNANGEEFSESRLPAQPSADIGG
jgi:hypothetical protein